jgi:Mce-associated membrane protein
VPPQRRNPGPPRRRPKIAGASRTRPESSTDAISPNPVTSNSEAERVEPTDVLDSSGPITDSPDSSVDPGRTDGLDEKVDLHKKADSDDTATPGETTAAAAVDPERTSGPGPDGTPLPTDGESRSGANWMPVVAVAAVAVVLGALAVVAAFRPGTSDGNVAWIDRAETAAVTDAAAHAIEAMHGYNFETIDEDFAEIRELLTDERREEFDSTAQVTKDAAVQTRTVTEVTVAHIGARVIDESQAEVAAYINVSATGDGVAQGSAAAPLLVRMEKSDGRWLVSEIRDQ